MKNVQQLLHLAYIQDDFSHSQACALQLTAFVPTRQRVALQLAAFVLKSEALTTHQRISS